MKKLFFALSLTASLLVSCDGHFDFPDTSVHVGDVLCTDGDILRYEDFKGSGKEAIGVVFHVNTDQSVEGSGYAVYLNDLPPVDFADSCGVSQNTSCSLTDHDGNTNTFSIMSSDDCGSELADIVFDMWRYGQSAYVPSVSQMRLLFQAKPYINARLSGLRGDILPDEADECWYWTSTEVGGQDNAKSWLFSMQSGTIQETPKIQRHKIRPIVTINH